MTEITHPASIITTICVSYFVSGGLGKEHGTTKPPPNKRIQERSNERSRVLSYSRILLLGIHFG